VRLVNAPRRAILNECLWWARLRERDLARDRRKAHRLLRRPNGATRRRRALRGRACRLRDGVQEGKTESEVADNTIIVFRLVCDEGDVGVLATLDVDHQTLAAFEPGIRG
jgi:hypothetical protein